MLMLDQKPWPFFLKNLNTQSIVPITGDGGHRKYYRLTTVDTTYILMQDIEIKKQYKITQKHAFSFINVHKILKDNNVSVPHIKKVFLEESCLLLEDLGNSNLYNQTNDSFQLYKKSIDELIKIQNIPHNCNLPTFQKSFNKDFLIQEMLQSLININNFYYPKQPLSTLSVKLISEINQFCNFLEQSSFCLIHRDYHSRNIMVVDEQVKVIDFQDARLGHPLYDLASLLEDPYSQLDQNSKKELKKYFQKQAKVTLFNDFDTHYLQISIHRLIKAASSFIRLADNQSNQEHDYLIDLPYAIKQSYHYIVKLNYPALETFINTLYKYP